MTAAEYHSIRAISSTWLRLCDPPARLKHRIDNPIVPTEEMRLGTDIHKVFLENDPSPITETAWKPEGLKLSTVEGKSWKAALKKGQRYEDESYHQALCGCVNSLCSHPVATHLLAHQTNESVFEWIEDDMPCKAMLDSKNSAYIADVKSGVSEGFASRERFQKIAWDRELHIQAAWYMHAASIHGQPAEKFLFIAVETTPPYLVNVFECSPAFLNAGVEEIDRRFPMIKHGLETGEWPGYDTRIAQLDIPRWAKRNTETLIEL